VRILSKSERGSTVILYDGGWGWRVLGPGREVLSGNQNTKRVTKRSISLAFLLALIFSSTAILSAAPAEHAASRLKVGLALSGGGAKGFAHIGVLKVLEEEGIPVDYITGTSMGSVVGSLYAIGYRAKDLERLALETEWHVLMSDRLPRRNIPIRERLNSDKYAVLLDIDDFSFVIPRGLVKGQLLESRLSLLMIPYHGSGDFGKLPVPFKCVATDIETGKAVVIGEGFLPDAVRASFSIPSIFMPVEVTPHLLVDGGVVRNFPVSDVREMGAQIVIGVDVGQPLYKKEELDSFGKIMEQSMSFLGDYSTREQRKQCDILVLPDIRGISSASFENVEDIISRGERAARGKLPEIRALAARLKVRVPSGSDGEAIPSATIAVRISEVKIEGLLKVSQTLVLAKLGIKTPSSVDPVAIEDGIRDVYGSGLFDKVSFRVLPDNDGSNILIVHVVEKRTDLLKFGFSYDTYLKGALLANYTFRNLLMTGNDLSVDAWVGENPGVKLSTFVYTGARPGIGIGVELESNRFLVDTSTTSDGREISGEYRLTKQEGRVVVNVELWNSVVFGAGLVKKSTFVDPESGSEMFFDENHIFESSSLLTFAAIDTLDNYYFPKSGFKIDGSVEYSTDKFDVYNRYDFSPFYKYFVSAVFALPLRRSISLTAGAAFGCIIGNEIPPLDLFHLGGVYTYHSGSIPLPGLRLFEISGKAMYTASVALSLEPWRGIFIIPRYSRGKAVERASDLKGERDLSWGYGFTFGFRNLVIPFELTGIHGDGVRGKRFLWYVNVGYRF